MQYFPQSLLCEELKPISSSSTRYCTFERQSGYFRDQKKKVVMKLLTFLVHKNVYNTISSIMFTIVCLGRCLGWALGTKKD